MRKSIFIITLLFFTIRFFSQNHYVVTSSNDPIDPFQTIDGELRYAIEQANINPGLDYIDFNITLNTPSTININSLLPAITDAIIIDGNTQPNNSYTGNAKKIIINANSFTTVLSINGTNASNSFIKNLELTGFAATGPYAYGIGVNISGSNSISILNNNIYSLVGPNDSPWLMWVMNSNNNILSGNVFGTNLITLSTNNIYNCAGLRFGYSSNNSIGGLLPNEANLFYNMISPWQWISLDIQLGNSNKIRGNLFINNVKNIDIYTNAGCLPMSTQGANLCKLPPNIISAEKSGLITSVSGTSSPNDVIEIYKSNAGGIDATELLITVIGDASGNFNACINGLIGGDKIIATATDLQENTSEFSLASVVSDQAPINNDFNGEGFFSYTTCQNNTTNCTETFSSATNMGNVSSVKVCVNNSINFDCDNNYTNPQTNFTWNFGDGSPLVYSYNGNGVGTAPYNTVSVAHTYSAMGNYSITISSSGNVCTTSTRTIAVQVIGNSSMEIQEGDLCNNEEIVMNAIAGCEITNPISYYYWQFGDGTVAGSSQAQSITHSYTSAGIYTVQLSISQGTAAIIALTKTITVTSCTPSCCSDLILSGVGFIPPVNCVTCDGTEIPNGLTFTNSNLIVNGTFDSDLNGWAVTPYGNWYWGSGKAVYGGIDEGGKMTQNILTTGKTYKVSLDLNYTFPGYPTIPSHFSIFLGTNEKAISILPSSSTTHIELYAVCTGTNVFKIHGRDDTGNGREYIIDNVTIIEGTPVLSSSVAVCSNNSFSLGVNGCSQALNYSWNFGDGVTATGSNVSHSYSSIGTYSVVFTANGNNCAPITKTITVVANNCSTLSPCCTVQNQTVTTCAGDPLPAMPAIFCRDAITSFTDYGDGTNSSMGGSHTYTASGNYQMVTTYSSSFCSTVSQTINVSVTTCTISTNCCDNSSLSIFNPKQKYCKGEPITFIFTGTTCDGTSISMGECESYPFSSVTNKTIIYTYNTAGTYIIKVYDPTAADKRPCIITLPITISDCDEVISSLAACQGSFRPSAGEYVLSFWVKEDLASLSNTITFSSGIEVVLNGMPGGPVVTNVFANAISNSANKIIDGWQKVEAVITIPSSATGIEINLKNNNSTYAAYFDDIRFHPFNSSFKSYVYDPVTLRLAAELDERNYATFYEYDEEGQLIRVKKETERGIKTIKESRTNVAK